MHKAIITKYLPATNYRGSRVKAGDEDGNTITISYPSGFSGVATHRQAADALCAKMGWTGDLVGGSLKYGYAFVFVC